MIQTSIPGHAYKKGQLVECQKNYVANVLDLFDTAFSKS